MLSDRIIVEQYVLQTTHCGSGRLEQNRSARAPTPLLMIHFDISSNPCFPTCILTSIGQFLFNRYFSFLLFDCGSISVNMYKTSIIYLLFSTSVLGLLRVDCCHIDYNLM